MAMTLNEILQLVGPLDDGPGESTARDRFRTHLGNAVKTVGAVRDYVETCLRTTEPVYARALQDLVNHCGRLLGFKVAFGRYQGTPAEIGYDGLWESPKGLAIVVEVKKTDVYKVDTATLVGYVDRLITEKRIPDWDHALGLYVVGRMDPGHNQLTNAITVEKRTHQLRVISIDSLLSLAELTENYDVSHEDVMGLLRPGGPVVDDIIRIIVRVTSQSITQAEPEPPQEPAEKVRGLKDEKAEGLLCLMTPVADEEDVPAERTIRSLLDQGWYVFGERTPGRKRLKPGDRLCFYHSGMGVVAEAKVATAPEKRKVKFVRDQARFPWAFRVSNVQYFFDKPTVIDADLRSRLDAFRGKDPNRAWAWFVQATRILTPHDFDILVRHE